jgi:putative hydrolase of the HAD superfamily
MTRNSVEAVLFDLDDTLLRYRRSPGEVLAEAFETVGVDPLFPVAAYYDRFSEFAARTDSMAELRRECFAALCSDRSHDPSVGREVADAYAAARDHRDVELLTGARETLRRLGSDYRLGVVTNGPPDAQRQKLDASGLGPAVDSVVYAGTDAPPKPDPKPFYLALDELDVAPAAAVHVGNSPDSDVAGARAAGLRSVWIPDDGRDYEAASVEADYRLDSLSGLRPPPWETPDGSSRHE